MLSTLIRSTHVVVVGASSNVIKQPMVACKRLLSMRTWEIRVWSTRRSLMDIASSFPSFFLHLLYHDLHHISVKITFALDICEVVVCNLRLEFRRGELLQTRNAEPHLVIAPKLFHVFIHAAVVHPVVKTNFTDDRRVLITISGVEIVLINTLKAPLAVHILKVVRFLNFVQDWFALQSAKDVAVADFVYWCLALRARVLHFLNPFLDAWIAVLVCAGV